MNIEQIKVRIKAREKLPGYKTNVVALKQALAKQEALLASVKGRT